MGGLLNGPIPDPPRPPKQEVEKSPFEISANRLEVDENASGTHFSIYWLVVK